MPSHFQFSISLEVLPSFCLFPDFFPLFSFFPNFFRLFLDSFPDFFPNFFSTFLPTFSRLFSRLFPDFFLDSLSTFFDFLWKAADPNLVTAVDIYGEHCGLISLLKREIFSSEGRQNGHHVHHSFTCNSQEIDSEYTIFEM